MNNSLQPSAGAADVPGSEANRAPTPERQTVTWMLALLILLAILPYVNTLQNGFVYDDNHEVVTNPYIRSFSHTGEIFRTRILQHLGSRGATNYYRPISVFGFLICYQLFGLLPYGFHLVNLLLHAAIVCLLFGLSRSLFRDSWLAFAAAALFALHPIHTESVAWVSGVTDVELTLFYLAAFWFYVASARPHGGRSEAMQLGMIASFTLALLSKEQAATLPLAAMVYEHFYRENRALTVWRQKVSRYGVLWLLVVAYVLFRIRFFGAFAPVTLTQHVSWYEAMLSAASLAGDYLWKMVWPVRLIAFYPFHKTVSPLDLRFLAGVAGVAACALIFVALWKRRLAISFGLVWFFLNLAPVLNSRWLGPNVFTERYLYLPSVGLCWVAGWGIVILWKAMSVRASIGRWAFGGLLALVALLAIARIFTRNGDWLDDGTYYRVTLRDVPEAGSLRVNLGAVYWNHMQAAAAEREWKLALAAAPPSALLLNDLGLVYTDRKQYDVAEDYFRRSMLLRPNYTDAHLNLGRVYVAEGKSAEAELQLRAAVALEPLSIDTRNELGGFYFAAGRLDAAASEWQASAASIPNARAYDSLGDVALRQGQRDAADRDFRQAIALDNFDAHGHFGLGAVFEAEGRAAEALAQFRAGLAVEPRNPEALAALQRLSGTPSHANQPKP